jgi:hypothetical protein
MCRFEHVSMSGSRRAGYRALIDPAYEHISVGVLGERTLVYHRARRSCLLSFRDDANYTPQIRITTSFKARRRRKRADVVDMCEIIKAVSVCRRGRTSFSRRAREGTNMVLSGVDDEAHRSTPQLYANSAGWFTCVKMKTAIWLDKTKRS